MDKRFKPMTLPEQLALRRQAIQEVAAHPEWSLSETIRHIRTSLRLTVPEFAQLTKVSARTIKDLEAGRSSGTVQTVESLLAVVGLKLGAQRQVQPQSASPQSKPAPNGILASTAWPKLERDRLNRPKAGHSQAGTGRPATDQNRSFASEPLNGQSSGPQAPSGPTDEGR